MFYAKLAISRSQCARGYARAEPADKYSTLSFLLDVGQEESARFRDLDRSPTRKKNEGREKCKRAFGGIKEDDHPRQLPTTDEFCKLYIYRAD